MKISKEALIDKLNHHLGLYDDDGTYIYQLTRVKEAFGYGTMMLVDFQEIDDQFVDELAEFILDIIPESQ